MALKDDWKKTGKNLGGAFKNLGSSVIKSVEVSVDEVENSFTDKENNENTDSNVFNDGTWRETGKDLGHAFKDLGKSIIKSTKKGIEYLEKEDSES